MKPSELKGLDRPTRKKIKQLEQLVNKVVADFQFRGLKTYEEMLKAFGYEESSKRWQDHKEMLQDSVAPSIIRRFAEPIKQRIINGARKDSKDIPSVPPTNTRVVSDEQKSTSIKQPRTVDDEAEKIVSETFDELNKADANILPPCSIQKCTLFPQQAKAAKELLDGILRDKKSGQLLYAKTGDGKTFVVGALVARLHEANFFENKSLAPYPILYITKASVIAQTEQVLEDHFGLIPDKDILVINIEQLRTGKGKLFVRKKTRFVNGEDEEYWEWHEHINPVLILFDESQGAKNSTSTQTVIMKAASNIKAECYMVQFSATPFMSVAEAECFALSTKHKVINAFGNTVTISEDNWSTFARRIADPADPKDFVPAAVNRLMKELNQYIVRLKGMKPQFHARNKCEIIPFDTEEDRLYYEKAWQRYQDMQNKAAEEADVDPRGAFMMELAARTIFRKAAEECKASPIARRMWTRVNKEGVAAVAAFNYKIGIIKTVKKLIEDYGVDRNQISIIWGGGQSGPTTKQKKLAALKDKMDMMAELGIGLADLDLEFTDEYQGIEVPKSWRLGVQNLNARNEEIRRFQSGRSLYCFYTFKAGGVGLSLHHNDEFSKYKVKRTRNNWYVPDDIPNCPVRRRVVDIAPTYSAVELAQGVGRVPRLTSMSDTEQSLLFFEGTVEVDVAATVSPKLACLREVVRTRESWEDVMFGAAKHMKPEYMKELEEDTGEDSNVDGFYSEEDE